MPLFRTQSAAEVTSLAPHDSKARLLSGRDSQGFMAKPCTPHLITRKGYATSVRQQRCQRLCHAQRVQLFTPQTGNGGGARGATLAGPPPSDLWGFQRGFSLRKENTPFGAAARTPLPLPRSRGKIKAPLGKGCKKDPPQLWQVFF